MTSAAIASRPRAVPSPTRELWVFIGLALALSWLVGAVGITLVGTLGLGLGAVVPGLVALWLTRRYEGSVRSLWGQITRWRLPLRWYAAAIGIPAAVMAAAWVSVLAVGGSWELEDTMPVAALPVWFVLTVLLFGGPEEPGWRGYALPRLQSRQNALTASLLLGVVWALWHGPLWLIPDSGYQDLSYPLYIVQVLAMCVVYTWLFNSSGGSVLLAVLLHAAGNTSLVYLSPGMQAQAAVTACWCAVAAAIVLRHSPQDLASSPKVDRDDMRRAAGLRV
jgi:uncharacterized protein